MHDIRPHDIRFSRTLRIITTAFFLVSSSGFDGAVAIGMAYLFPSGRLAIFLAGFWNVAKAVA
jgi:hypothetical protein